jgi:hypothetical protein
MSLEEVKESESTLMEDDKSSAPFYTIEFCLSMIKSIVSQRGETPFSKKDAALLLEKSASNVSIKLGACGQYGLLSNDRGKGYRVTPLYNKIELFTSVEQKNASLLTAMNNPPVYKKLIDDYNGKVLPTNEEMFVNLLVSSYSMIKASAVLASRIFIKNAKNFNIIDANNRLRLIMPVVNDNGSIQDKNDNSDTDGSNDAGKNNPPPPPPNDKMFKLPVDLGDKTAYLEYPKDITVDEIETLKIMLDASLKALELRKNKSKNPD